MFHLGKFSSSHGVMTVIMSSWAVLFFEIGVKGHVSCRQLDSVRRRVHVGGECSNDGIVCLFLVTVWFDPGIWNGHSSSKHGRGGIDVVQLLWRGGRQVLLH